MEINNNTLIDSDIEIAISLVPSIFDKLRLDRFLPAPASQGTQMINYIGLILNSIVVIVMMFLLIFILVGIKESNGILKDQSKLLEYQIKLSEEQRKLLEEQCRMLEKQNIILSIYKIK
jgi:hypothetical protein